MTIHTFCCGKSKGFMLRVGWAYYVLYDGPTVKPYDIQRLLSYQTHRAPGSGKELWVRTKLCHLSNVEITTPILQMRKIEGRGHGASGRLCETAVLYHSVGGVRPEGKPLSHQPTPASQEPCRPSKFFKIENLEGLKPQRTLQVPRKKGRLSVHSNGWHSNLFFISAGCTLTHHRISSQNREVPVESSTPFPASCGHLSKC